MEEGDVRYRDRVTDYAACRIITIVLVLQLAVSATFDALTDGMDDMNSLLWVWFGTLFVVVITAILCYGCFSMEPYQDDEYTDDLAVPVFIMIQLAIGASFVILIGSDNHAHRAWLLWGVVVVLAIVFAACTCSPPRLAPPRPRFYDNPV